MRAGRCLLIAIFVVNFLKSVQCQARGLETSESGPPSVVITSRTSRKKEERWLRGGRIFGGQSAAELRFKAYRQKLQMRKRGLAAGAATAAPRASAAAVWTALGPAPLDSDASGSGVQNYNWVSGRATAVAIDPNDSSGNTVYVGGAFGGLWKSRNAGPICPDPSTVTWNVPAGQNSQTCVTPASNSPPASLLDDQPTLSVGAIAIQPQLSNADPTKSVILVGTGETNSSTDSYYGLGILRSADAGSTWTLTSQDNSVPAHSFAGIGVSQIAFNATNPNLVVAAAASATQGELDGLANPLTANLGLYSSSDGGQSWNYAITMDGGAAVSPGSATAVAYNAAAGEFFAALRFHGFYSSPDGMNWTRLSNQPGNGLLSASCPASPTSQICPIYRGEIAVVPGRAGPDGLGEMYVWYTDSNDTDQGIWKTVDGGMTWRSINDSGITNCGDVVGGCGTEDASYNLALVAMPDNPNPTATTGTDLYAGAINLYKCVTIASVPDCSGSAPNTFLNLTHVYGCPPEFGSIAKVHPSQHAMDFMQINGGGQVVMYFANDGGIYRALDGYSGLISGDCATPNQFDSLNQTLGSMTQFISLAQHPTDPNTLLGGSQGNGSPATSNSQSSTNWISLNSGDGGYSAINPANPVEWFTENTGITIQRCALGVDCHSTDFNNDLVVSSATVGGDTGPLYTPYLLDPQNSAEMIVGTCRVWRGSTQGANFTALSQNFDTQSADICTGSEVNTVRSLAVGGPLDVNGFSSVIYAGTDGTGPLENSPGGGRVWVMTTAAAGATTWNDVTGNINPDNFPISAIAVDASDATGNTAYVTIMGFHVSHVWQTVNGGQSWTDFSGDAPASLPDAPANSVLVDGSSLYVGTDVGVFASTTNSSNWTEVGPSAIPFGTQSGNFPNVPVTALGVFNNGTTKLLRAASYGRGVWQFPLSITPDFGISVSPSSQTVFAGQTATFNGTLDAFDGFNSQITLVCSGNDLPSTCSPTPNQITPAGFSTSFPLATAGSVGDYSVTLVGTGAGLARSAPLALHIIDFTLGTPAPAMLTVSRGSTSSPITTEVDFLGSYPASGSVSLSCNAPSEITCNFVPGNSIPASAGPTTAVTLTISASSGAQDGAFTVTIEAISTDAGTKTASQPLGLTVTGGSDYSIAINTPASPTAVKQTALTGGTILGLNGYNNTIQLSCVSGSTPPPSTCRLNPAEMNASSTAGPFTVSASSDTAGTFSFNVQGTGNDASASVHDAPVTLTFFDFAISANSNTQTVNAGQPAIYVLNFTPEGPSTFQQSVSYSCGALPALTSCSFNPSQIASGAGQVQVTLTISTTGAIAALHAPGFSKRGAFVLALLLPVAGMFLSLIESDARRRRGARPPLYSGLFVSIVVILLLIQSACGGGLTGSGNSGSSAQPGTTPGTYAFTITATEGTGAQALQAPAVSLTLTVQ